MIVLQRTLLATLLAVALSGCPSGRSTPPVTAGTPPLPAPTSPALVAGEALFKTHCSVCHQGDGRGVSGSYPPLDGSEWVAAAPEAAISVVLLGLEGEVSVKGERFDSQMPPLDLLSDQEVAAILTYVRASWSNAAGAVAAEQVAAVRKSLQGREGPWKGEAELREFLGARAPSV